MSDLISRKALMEALVKAEEECEDAMCVPSWATALRVIRSQPTAYDVKSVEEQIHEYFKGQLDILYEKLKPSNEIPIDAIDDLLSHNKAVCNIVEKGGEADET